MTETEIKALMAQLAIGPLAKHIGIRQKDRHRAINARLRTLFAEGRVSGERADFIAYIRVLSRHLNLFADYLENTKK